MGKDLRVATVFLRLSFYGVIGLWQDRRGGNFALSNKNIIIHPPKTLVTQFFKIVAMFTLALFTVPFYQSCAQNGQVLAEKGGYALTSAHI